MGGALILFLIWLGLALEVKMLCCKWSKLFQLAGHFLQGVGLGALLNRLQLAGGQGNKGPRSRAWLGGVQRCHSMEDLGLRRDVTSKREGLGQDWAAIGD